MCSASWVPPGFLGGFPRPVGPGLPSLESKAEPSKAKLRKAEDSQSKAHNSKSKAKLRIARLRKTKLSNTTMSKRGSTFPGGNSIANS